MDTLLWGFLAGILTTVVYLRTRAFLSVRMSYPGNRIDRLFGNSRTYRRKRRGHWERRIDTSTGRRLERWLRLDLCLSDLRLTYQDGGVVCENWNRSWQCFLCRDGLWRPDNDPHPPWHGATCM